MQTSEISPLALLESMTAVKLAEVLGVKVNTVYSWKSGKRNPPKTAKKLAYLFRLEQNQELLTDKNLPISPLELTYQYPLELKDLASLMGVTLRSVKAWKEKDRSPKLTAQKLAGLILRKWQSQSN